MKNGIVILDSNPKNSRGLCAILNERNYWTIPVNSLAGLPAVMDENNCQVLILDLDNVPVDLNWFRKLKRTKPSLYIVGLSSRSFHPGLEEAMSNHIYACISKPIDEEELVFWLKSVV